MRKIKVEDLDDSNGIPLEETNNEDLELFHNIIKEKFNSQLPEEKFRNILISIRFKMEELC